MALYGASMDFWLKNLKYINYHGNPNPAPNPHPKNGVTNGAHNPAALKGPHGPHAPFSPIGPNSPPRPQVPMTGGQRKAPAGCINTRVVATTRPNANNFFIPIIPPTFAITTFIDKKLSS